MIRLIGRALIVTFLAWPASALAQQESGLAGLVRDTSGAVLPGVTVEAASPALIERVRTAVTDGDGRYNIVDLRPGTYVVTFSLPGFATVKREGIVLTAGFTAPVNADMPVGALEETLTVTGASPLVDTQNARQQKVVAKELLDTLPVSGTTVSNLAALTPGMTGNVNVGGATGIYNGTSSINTIMHGKRGAKSFFDGLRVSNANGGGSTGYVPNPGVMEEWSVETGGGSAESPAAGVVMNMIPKQGGNTFTGSVNGLYSNDAMQSNNLTDELLARAPGFNVNKVLNVHEIATTLGGPLRQDRVWFLGSFRKSGNRNQIGGIYYNKTQGAPLYTPDFDRPSKTKEFLWDYALRMTFQATPRNKISVFADYQDLCACNFWAPTFIAPEAVQYFYFKPQGLYMASWNSPVTNKLLLEASAGYIASSWPQIRQPETGPHDISTIEQSTGFRYNSATGTFAYTVPAQSDRISERFALSYVTGSHVFKTGMLMDHAISNVANDVNDAVDYAFNQFVPVSITQWATPYLQKDRVKADLAIYAQDKWTFNRLTVNAGLRFEYFNGYVPAQSGPATRFVPARSFDRVDCTPCWTDLSPRLGVSYDLFGTGVTALRFTVGRYTAAHTTDMGQRVNPIVTSVNSVTRTWSDNGNFVPDCDLNNPAANSAGGDACGPISNENFGKANPNATRFSDDVLRGFGNRDYLWDIAAEVQQQLGARMSVTGGYYRNWYGNFQPIPNAIPALALPFPTDNELVTPADFDPFCITAPTDPRLPGGGGYQVCGLYDVTPALFGRNRSVVTQGSEFGKQKQVSDFFNVSVTTRLGGGAQVGGGIDTGRTVQDNCFVIDSPQQLLNCRVVTPFSALTQIKLFGSYTLPANILVSAMFQNVAGPQILANYAVPNSAVAPALGRNLAACGTRTVCTSTVTVPLIAPQTMFEDDRNQLDLRFSKIFPVGPKVRLRANMDVYNVLNASSVLSSNPNYGSSWLRPVGSPSLGGSVLPGRLFQFGGQLTF